MKKNRINTKETKCLFETEDKVPTCNKYDKEACSSESIKKGYNACIYIWEKEKAKAFREQEILDKEKLYES